MTQPLITWDFNPVFFSIGSLDVRYYGLMWALALLIGAWFFDNFVKREGLPRKVSESIFLYGTLATILGARLGHCLFYEPAYYLARPWAIITEFRNGGMASHGAAIGLLIGLWLFSRRNRLPFVWSLDRIMIPVGIGGADRAAGQPVQFGNRGAGDRPALGIQIPAALSGRSCRAGASATPHTALRSRLLPAYVRSPYVALL